MIDIGKLYSQSLSLQILDYISELILRNDYKPHDKLPSVRMLAAELQVNPNTIMKAYDRLQIYDIVYSMPGRGLYVTEAAKDNILFDRRVRFVHDVMPAILREMELLGFTNSDLDKYEELKEKYIKRNLLKK